MGAAAALPTAYTLESGAQAAATSALRCFLAEPPPGLAPFTTADDGFLRSQVYVGKQGSNVAYCVMPRQAGNPAACVSAVDPTKAAPGSVWIVNGQRVVAGNPADPIPGVNIVQVSSAPQPYGLVYVNREGQIATLDRNGDLTLRSVADSCWNSIMGGRISQLG